MGKKQRRKSQKAKKLKGSVESTSKKPSCLSLIVISTLITLLAIGFQYFAANNIFNKNKNVLSYTFDYNTLSIPILNLISHTQNKTLIEKEFRNILIELTVNNTPIIIRPSIGKLLNWSIYETWLNYKNIENELKYLKNVKRQINNPIFTYYDTAAKNAFPLYSLVKPSFEFDTIVIFS